jgi:alginate O-acetyltransferase complex protein AlgI
MIFCTPWFLIFTVVVSALALVVRAADRVRLGLMLAASIVFYLHFAGPVGFAVILALAVFTYFAGLFLHRQRRGDAPPRKAELLLCLGPAVGALLYFRYTGLLTGQVTHWLGLGPSPAWATALQPTLVPLGISFFAFEFCHYLVDLAHGAAPVRNPLHFGLFALFYPRLASGPIVRFQQIVPQLEQLRRPDLDDVSQGLLRIGIGFSKKFILADPAAQLISTSFQPANILAGTDVLWLGLLLYVRIYMDFGGYSDMAIGLARLWGIRLPENFNFPFLAASPSTFWHRWHISLSSWIRDYIYIPLGGGRVPAWRKSANLLLAMAICGLWHGAAWNFVLWGVLHGLALQLGHAVTAIRKALAARIPAPDWLCRAGGFAALLFGWVLTQSFAALAWIPFFFSAADSWKIIAQLRLLL